MKNKVFLYLVIFTLISTILVTLSLFFYVAQYDYVYIPIYDTTSQLNNNSIIPSGILQIVEDTITGTSYVPTYIDYFWFVSFVILIIEMFYISYHTKREGYFSALSIMTYGIMIFMFISSIFYDVGTWFYNVIVNGLLAGVTFNTPFFTYYLTNYGLINMIVIIICILLNFLDFDMIKFQQRKVKETASDELG